MTPSNLRTFCETDWPALRVGWPSQVSLDKFIVNRVFEMVVWEPRYPDQFPYSDCWQDEVFSWPTWLKLHIEEACMVMVARVAAAFKCWKKYEKQRNPY
jgi:hypothetical protein